jgi:hypothetical protein
MRFRSLLTTTIFLAFMLSALSAFAQSGGWNLGISGASASPVGVTRDHLNTGWNVDVGAERALAMGLGLRADFGYFDLGVSERTLQALQVPDGQAHMYSLTIGPTWRFAESSKVHGYVLGGVGWYRRTVDFLQPTVGLLDIIDPWWGYVGSVFVPADQVLGSVTSNAFGGSVGGGVSISLGDDRSEVFLELRYHDANTKGSSTGVVPVSFGIRWGGGTMKTP